MSNLVGPVKHMVEKMGVPAEEAEAIRKSVDRSIQLSTDGHIHDYSGQMMHYSVMEAKRRGYKEAGDGVSE